jgi:hypothetical protein
MMTIWNCPNGLIQKKLKGMKYSNFVQLKKIFYQFRGQLFFLKNLDSMVLGIWIGFLATFAISSLTDVLIFTKQSSTRELAYKRFKKNVLYIKDWLQYDIKPGTK